MAPTLKSESVEAAAEDLTETSVASFDLPLSETGKIVADLDSIQANYENLAYTCNVL